MPKITAKGQVTIPKAVREDLGVGPGDEIDFQPEDGIYTIRKRVAREDIRRYRGYLKHLKGRRSDELVAEMRDG